MPATAAPDPEVPETTAGADPTMVVDLTFPDGDVSRPQYSTYRSPFDRPDFQRGVAFFIGADRATFRFRVDPGSAGITFDSVDGRPVVSWIDPRTGCPAAPREDLQAELEDGGRACRVAWHRPPDGAPQLSTVGLRLRDGAGGAGEAFLTTRAQLPEVDAPPICPREAKPRAGEEPESFTVDVHFAGGDASQPRYVNVFDYATIPDGLELEPALIVPDGRPLRFDFHLLDPSVRFVPCGDGHRVAMTFADPETGDGAPEPLAFEGNRLRDGGRRCEIHWREPAWTPDRCDSQTAPRRWRTATFLLEATGAGGTRIRIDPTVIHHPPEPPPDLEPGG